MTNLRRLQSWYAAQCNGEWEHHHGVSIQSCDNPGWRVRIDIEGTPLEHKSFIPVEHNVSLKEMEQIAAGLKSDACDRGSDWMLCRVKEKVFDGAGGPEKLEAMLGVFLTWAEEK
jgi:hypothetical protein